jgi:hypothetical protein
MSVRNGSPLACESLGVCMLWRCGRRRGLAGIRIISSDPKELEVPIQLVIDSVMGVSGLEILPILFAEDAEVVGVHAFPAEIGHGLEVAVERWFPEFGGWGGGYLRDGWENFVIADFAYDGKLR